MEANRIKIAFVNLSLQKKLTICFAGIICIPIVVLGFFSFQTASDDMRKQVADSIGSNVMQIITDLDGRFQRETDFTKFFAYNLELRKMLNNPPDRITLAKTMTDRWEPTFWYFLTSDINLKAVKIYSPKVDSQIGSFLHPDKAVSDHPWYQYQQQYANTTWWCDGAIICASRTILSPYGDMRDHIGTLYAEFYRDRLLEPLLRNQYLSNGFVLVDGEGNPILERRVNSERVQGEIDALVAAGGVAANPKNSMLSVGKLENGWQLYYFVDNAQLSGRLDRIIGSTLAAAGVCLLLSWVLIGILAQALSSRILRLRDYAKQIADGNLNLTIKSDAQDEIGVVTNSIGRMSQRLNDMINRVYKSELEKRLAELKALQAMINPHFLYNCLSTIKWRALQSDANDIGDIAGLLARFYRTNLNEGRLLTTVGNEVDNVQSYIQLQLATHEDSFDVEYHVDESCLELSMLNFLLQPIVENAIKHGIDQIEGEERGRIVFELHREADYLIFRVSNNGPPLASTSFDELLLKESGGYGMKNIQERIALYYGGSCGISLGSTAEGNTCVQVRIFTEVSENL